MWVVENIKVFRREYLPFGVGNNSLNSIEVEKVTTKGKMISLSAFKLRISVHQKTSSR